jgi:hypothetical protein
LSFSPAGLGLRQSVAVLMDLLDQATLLEPLQELGEGSACRMAFAQGFGDLSRTSHTTQATEKIEDIIFRGCVFVAQDEVIVARKPAPPPPAPKKLFPVNEFPTTFSDATCLHIQL